MKTVSDKDLVKSVKILEGNAKPVDVNLFSIIKDEMYFLPSFFNYYRKLGVDKFFILEDGSSDGTLDFLVSQPDCTVLKSNFAYGETVAMRGGWRFWTSQKVRAGIEFKRLLPIALLSDHWCVYADADEFLLLPPGFDSLKGYLSEIERYNRSLVISSMLSFFPERLRDIETVHDVPTDLTGLLKISPFFDGVPTFYFAKSGKTESTGWTAEERLMIKHGINKRKAGPGARKVSLFKPSRRLFLCGSHEANRPAPQDFVNCVAHFKFTPDLFRRMNLALETKAWSGGSKKYSDLERLLNSMRNTDDSFLGDHSVRYRDQRQLGEYGIIRYPGETATQEA